MKDGWIQTYTGKRFFPLQPRAEDVDVRDIAHALSLQCRFNGHCKTFYSVADHSVGVSRVLAGESRELQLGGLLHDAGEAYVGDLPRPVKAQLSQFSEVEDHLLRMIYECFGLTWPLPQQVVQADEVMLATEARDLMGDPPAAWGLRAQPHADQVVPLPPREAEQAYLRRFEELTP